MMEPQADTAREHIVRFLTARNPELDEKLIDNALSFVQEAHRNQFRKSGVPYAEHPFEVAKILAELKLDTPTIIAGLLHDVVEDTKIPLEEIQSHFGSEVAFMVDAVTKIASFQASPGSKIEQKAATYRKLLVSMAKDPRVIMIKLADRLHNMRTLNYMPAEKRRIIAQETLDLYAPLTHRFGLYRFKFELEDLSFKYLNPEKYRQIVESLQNTRREREVYLQKVIRPLEMKLNLEAMQATIQGRPKHIYSIWRKMSARGCAIEDMFDLFAVRIIVGTVTECYVALGYVHNLWTPLQSRFKDYIASPKPNLYQSLHTTVIGPEGKAVEIQIRTRDMDEMAEKGFAAHWSYKIETADEDQLSWLQQLVKAQNEITDSSEFLEFLRVDLKPQEMLVFTPKGDAVSLPNGASVLDFAFAVHTRLGYHCIGARVDDTIVGPEKALSYGQTVHVLRGSSQEPSLDWMQFVKTTKARAAIRRWHRTSLTTQAISLGKEILAREIRLLGLPKEQQPNVIQLAPALGASNPDSLYESIGRGRVPVTTLADKLAELVGPEAAERRRSSRKFLGRFRRRIVEALKLDGHGGNLVLHPAPCCNPLPGDRLVGRMVPDQGIEIHVEGCATLNALDPTSLLPVEWSDQGGNFLAKVEVQAQNRSRLLEDIASTIAAHDVSVERGSILTHRDTVRDRFTVRIQNQSQLDSLLRALRGIASITRVTRL